MQTPADFLGGCLHFMKIHELFDGFLRDCEADGLHKYTRHHHKKVCEKVIGPALNGIDIESLIPIHANLIIERAATFSQSMPERSILTFRKLVRYAKNCRIPVGVIAEEIKIPKYRRQKDVRAWSGEEIALIRNEILKDFSSEFSKHTPERQRLAHPITVARLRALIEAMLHSGIRLSEALSSDISNVDWEKEELRVEDCKAPGTWKTVYLHGALPAIREYLKVRTDNNTALFVSVDGKRLCVATAQSALKRLKQRIKKKDKKFEFPFNHKTCRKTFVTIPLRAGHDPRQVQLMSHHKSLYSVLNYYYEVEKERMKPLHKELFSCV